MADNKGQGPQSTGNTEAHHMIREMHGLWPAL
jgi:hypothetical protein